MTTFDRIKLKIETVNPIARTRRSKMRAGLKNRNITFLAPNCIGGILFHDLGLEFMSPTVNLMLNQRDFVKFVTHLDEYLEKDFKFFQHPELTCPCATLGDITVTFTHFASETEAAAKWKERAKRIQRNNLFIFAEERDGITKEEILSLGKLDVKGIVVFTAHEYPDIPYAVCIPKYKEAGEVGNILARNYINDQREYELFFDFVKWFNEADGGDYDVARFSRIG